MRRLLLSLTAAALIAPLASAPASAQGCGYRNGYGYSHGYGYGHRNDVRRRAARMPPRAAPCHSHREYYRELRECRRRDTPKLGAIAGVTATTTGTTGVGIAGDRGTIPPSCEGRGWQSPLLSPTYRPCAIPCIALARIRASRHETGDEGEM